MKSAVSGTVRVACVQMNSGMDVDANVAFIQARLHEAASQGAQWVVTPEMCLRLGGESREVSDFATSSLLAAGVRNLRETAREVGVSLLLGSLPVIAEAPASCSRKVYNQSQWYQPDGPVTVYNKMHLYDADPGDGTRYRESDQYVAGTTPAIASTPFGKVGMTICYDLRFAALYRHLALCGCVVFTVPSAFTRPSGEAHWETLLRARAIETGAYVVAPAQCGEHGDGRSTWGQSMMVDPWGRIVSVASAGDRAAPEMLLADLDLDAVADARRRIPSLHERNSDSLPPVEA